MNVIQPKHTGRPQRVCNNMPSHVGEDGSLFVDLILFYIRRIIYVLTAIHMLCIYHEPTTVYVYEN